MGFYNKIAMGYEELYGEEQRKKLRIIKKNFNIKGKILDIGSGIGLSKEFFEDVVCLEPVKEMLKEGDIFGYAERLPFEDKSFDGVICVTVLHNVKDPRKVVKEIKRVCKGKVAFSILKKSRKFERLRELLHKNFILEEINEEKDLILIGC